MMHKLSGAASIQSDAAQHPIGAQCLYPVSRLSALTLAPGLQSFSPPIDCHGKQTWRLRHLLLTCWFVQHCGFVSPQACPLVAPPGLTYSGRDFASWHQDTWTAAGWRPQWANTLRSPLSPWSRRTQALQGGILVLSAQTKGDTSPVRLMSLP